MSDQGRVAGKTFQTIELGGGIIGTVTSLDTMVIPSAIAGRRFLISPRATPKKSVAVSVVSIAADGRAKLSCGVPGVAEGDPFQRQYTLKPYVVGIWAEMSALVRSLKGDPIKEVCDRLDLIPPEQRSAWMKTAVEAAANQTPTEDELASFEKSLMGTAFKLWSTLKADHIDEFPTPQSVMDKLIGLSEKDGENKLAEIMLKVQVASGEEDLKNSSGQPATTV